MSQELQKFIDSMSEKDLVSYFFEAAVADPIIADLFADKDHLRANFEDWYPIFSAGEEDLMPSKDSTWELVWVSYERLKQLKFGDVARLQ